MNQRKVRLSSVRILFAVIVICTILITMAALSAAKADYNETKTYAEHIKNMYSCEQQGQIWLFEVTKAVSKNAEALSESDLPDGTRLEDGIVSTTISEDNQILEIKVKINEDKSCDVIKWENYTSWSVDDSLNLWQED